MRVIAHSTTHRDRGPSRTLMLLIGMTMVGLLVLIMLLALIVSGHEPHCQLNRNIGTTS